MPASWNGITQTDLNNYMKNRVSGIIVPDLFEWGTLDDDLKACFRKDGFSGDLVEALIQTSHAHTGTAFGDGVDIPYPDDFGFVKMWIPLKETIVNAGISMQQMRRATGGNASWGNVVEKVLAEQRRDWMWLRELAAMGDGTGRLARVASATGGTTAVITVDNSYADFGWDSTMLIKPGMWVEIWKTDGTMVGDVSGGVALSTTVNAFQVTAVAYTDRNNAIHSNATGTITLAVTTNDLATSIIDSNATIYLAGTRSATLADSAGTGSGTATCYVTKTIGSANSTTAGVSLPVGLVGLVANGAASFATHAMDDDQTYGNYELSTFQGLTRASYPTLQSTIYRGADFDGTDGTPSDWSLSVIDDAIESNYRNSGKKTNRLLCSGQLARAIDRRNRAENNVVTQVGSATAQKMNAYGSGFASAYISPIDGSPIPIRVSYTIPRNVLYGLCTEDLHWDTKGNFDFLKLNGQVWDKSYNDRKANFEAPFGGMENRWAERCDSQWKAEDLRDDI